MAHSDKNILITPNIGSTTADPKIVFSGANASLGPQNITLQVYPTSNGTLSFEGSAGQLFSISNSMTGTIFSANDVSGIPSIEVLDTGLVKLAQYSGNVLLGSGTDNGAKLQVTGSATITSTTDSFLTLNKSSGTAWNYINFSQAGTRRFYFGINASSEPELGTDNSSVFRVLGGMTIAGNVALHAGNYNSYSPTLTGTGASGSWGIDITGNAATASNGGVTSVNGQTGAVTVSAGTTFTGGTVANATTFDSEVIGKSYVLAEGVLYAKDSIAFWHSALPGWTTIVSQNVSGGAQLTNITYQGNTILHAGNYTGYSPGLTGTGASGTWGINISGNAANGGVTSVNGQTGAVTVSASGGLAFGKALVFAR
jgi:hypothetical protein